MLDGLLALLLALAFPTATESAAPGRAPATVPQESTVTAPRGTATLDGTLAPGEWSGAFVGQLTGNGEIRLMHDGGYLYLGVRHRGILVVTVCLDQGDSVSVLHSSAALGTAVYRRAENLWDLVRRFTWELRDSTMTAVAQQEREAFLRREGWVATNGYTGARTDTEFKIAMPSGRVRLAVAPMSVGENYQEMAWWPRWLADGCRVPDLLSGHLPERLHFAPESWMNVIAGR